MWGCVKRRTIPAGRGPTATLLACPHGIWPYGPARMLAKRIVPLIVAVALFMENMDSTVIATSLPAIAADIGTSPLTLKLAVTAYLLSLAVFIPVSGWTADRFGARTVFPQRHRGLHARLDRLRALQLVG